MSANTKIPWAHHTVNFWWGCEKVSPACEHCYAEGIAWRFRPKEATWGKDGKRLIRKDAAARELRALDRSARKRGVRERVFIESMGDLFEDRPELAFPRNMLFVVAEKLTNLDLLLLTKRPQNVLPMLEAIRKYWMAEKLPLFPHIWIGVTVENQEQADKRIPALLQIPTKVRFLSCEPLLGPVDLSTIPLNVPRSENDPQMTVDALSGLVAGPDEYGGKIHWVICGGESGPKALPMHPDWARSLHDQCEAAGVPFFFKQWGEWKPTLYGGDGKAEFQWVEHGEPWQWMCKVGKKAAGRLLDGIAHDSFPIAEGTK